MSSAISFDLDQSKILSSGNGLGHVGKDENVGYHHIYTTIKQMFFGGYTGIKWNAT